MNTKIILLLLFSCSFQWLLAQESQSPQTSNKNKGSTTSNCCSSGPVDGVTRLGFDFCSKNFKQDFKKKIKKLEPGDFYQIEISNINTYLYQVLLESEDSIIDTQLTVPTFATLGFDDLSTLLGNISSLELDGIFPAGKEEMDTANEENMLEEIASLIKKNRNQSAGGPKPHQPRIEEEIKAINESGFANSISQLERLTIEWITKAKSFDYNSTPTFPIAEFIATRPDTKAIEALSKEVKSSAEQYKKDMIKYRPSLEKDPEGLEAHQKIVGLYEDFERRLKSLTTYTSDSKMKSYLKGVVLKRIAFDQSKLSGFDTELQAIKQDLFDWQLGVEKDLAKLKINEVNKEIKEYDGAMKMDELLNERQGILDDVEDLVQRAKSAKGAYQTEIKAFKDKNVFEKQKDIIAADQKINAAYDSLLAFLGKTEEKISAEQTTALLDKIALIANHRCYNYTSLPQYFGGDIEKLQITFKPWDSTSRLPTYKTDEIQLPPYRNSYFATGTSFYISGLYDEAFSSIAFDTTRMVANEMVDTSAFSLVQEDPGENEIGIYANLNFGFKFGDKRKWGLGLNFGPGISLTSKVRPRLLTGFNLSYGRRSHISIGFGGIAGYVNRKSNAIDPDQAYFELPDDVVVSKLETSWFAQIGYFYAL